jgi:hypothetical protein
MVLILGVTTARVIGFVINAKGSQHKLYVVCVLNGEDWSKIKTILPKLLSKIRWRNRNIFDLILFSSDVMVDNYFNKSDGDEYEEAITADNKAYRRLQNAQL